MADMPTQHSAAVAERSQRAADTGSHKGTVLQITGDWSAIVLVANTAYTARLTIPARAAAVGDLVDVAFALGHTPTVERVITPTTPATIAAAATPTAPTTSAPGAASSTVTMEDESINLGGGSTSTDVGRALLGAAQARTNQRAIFPAFNTLVGNVNTTRTAVTSLRTALTTTTTQLDDVTTKLNELLAELKTQKLIK